MSYAVVLSLYLQRYKNNQICSKNFAIYFIKYAQMTENVHLNDIEFKISGVFLKVWDS